MAARPVVALVCIAEVVVAELAEHLERRGSDVRLARQPWEAAPLLSAASYDVSKEVTLRGKVERVIQHHDEGRLAIHLIVATGSGRVEVHVAPPDFLKRNLFVFERGDPVEITASRPETEEHYLARLIQKGSRTLTLRDDHGAPLWGQGRDH